MTENVNAGGQQEAQATFQIQRVYIKDLSLEMPNAPQIFLDQTPPNIDITVDVGAERLAETIYEAVVAVTVTSKVGDKIAFLAEIKQAGIFEIAGVPADQMDPLLGILCPGMIYPYLRANMADLVTRTGYPPIHLADINFEAFYQQRLAAAQQQAQAANGLNGSGIILPPGNA